MRDYIERLDNLEINVVVEQTENKKALERLSCYKAALEKGTK